MEIVYTFYELCAWAGFSIFMIGFCQLYCYLFWSLRDSLFRDRQDRRLYERQILTQIKEALFGEYWARKMPKTFSKTRHFRSDYLTLTFKKRTPHYYKL